MRRSFALLALVLTACGVSDSPPPANSEVPETAEEKDAPVPGADPEVDNATTAAGSGSMVAIEVPTSACRVENGKAVPENRIRAVGTEPFWGAKIEGRCITYSHPDDQSGRRVWTRFTGITQAGVWSGAYGGKPFVLRTRPQASCSDGMSDRRYPIAVTLSVGGEERHGCAERL